MYQNKYPKMIISIGIYSINRREAGYGRGGCICMYIYIYIYMRMYVCKHIYIYTWHIAMYTICRLYMNYHELPRLRSLCAGPPPSQV